MRARGVQESLEHKLTKKQRLDIAINKILLLLQSSRIDEARRECQRLAQDFPDNPRVAVAQATVAYKEKKGKGAEGAEEAFQAYLSTHKGDEEAARTSEKQLASRRRGRFDLSPQG